MLKIYISFKCIKCKKELILITEEFKSHKGYIACPYCNSQKLVKTKETNDLRECMQEDAFKREHGALRQVRHK